MVCNSVLVKRVSISKAKIKKKNGRLLKHKRQSLILLFNLCPLYLCRCAILEFKSGQEAASCVEGNKDVEVGDHKIKLSHCYPMPDHGQSSLGFSPCSIYKLKLIEYQY